MVDRPDFAAMARAIKIGTGCTCRRFDGWSITGGACAPHDTIATALARAWDARGEADETGWLIEWSPGPDHAGDRRARWWDGAGPDTYTFDAAKAVRFVRREDAQAVIRLGYGNQHAVKMMDAQATEHVWVDAIRAATTSGTGEGRDGE